MASGGHACLLRRFGRSSLPPTGPRASSPALARRGLRLALARLALDLLALFALALLASPALAVQAGRLQAPIDSEDPTCTNEFWTCGFASKRFRIIISALVFLKS